MGRLGSASPARDRWMASTRQAGAETAAIGAPAGRASLSSGSQCMVARGQGRKSLWGPAMRRLCAASLAQGAGATALSALTRHRVHRLVLPDHAPVQLISQVQQLLALAAGAGGTAKGEGIAPQRSCSCPAAHMPGTPQGTWSGGALSALGSAHQACSGGAAAWPTWP